MPPNVLKKGHRLRLDISSSNFPCFDVNPKHRRAAGPPPEHDKRRKYCLPRQASCLVHRALDSPFVGAI